MSKYVCIHDGITTVDAFRFTRIEEVEEIPNWLMVGIEKGRITIIDYKLVVFTVGGKRTVEPNDYIVRHQDGSYEVLKPHIFEDIYKHEK